MRFNLRSHVVGFLGVGPGVLIEYTERGQVLKCNILPKTAMQECPHSCIAVFGRMLHFKT
jgi:hypothetical protein